ncbi:MAG: ATP-binding protein [Actinomycetia bacterium]|nr:ATP-binding protein [Actinomycetes bacterium]
MSTTGTLPDRALELPPDPRSASQARRWVRKQLAAIGREDLTDSATLAVSELVANAVIHARSTIWVALRPGEPEPRIDVYDLSRRRIRPRPVVSEELHDMGNNGNGISLVAAMTSSWGVEPWGDGKCVWFIPAPPDTPAGSDFVEQYTSVRPQTAPIDVYLLDTPVDLLWQSRMYYRDLRREIMLINLQPDRHPEEPDALVELAQRFDEVNPVFLGDEQILDRAYMRGEKTTTLHYQTKAEERTDCIELTLLFDRAEEFCRQKVLLTLPPPEDQVRVRHWQFDEFVRQIDGKDPISWTDALPRGEVH